MYTLSKLLIEHLAAGDVNPVAADAAAALAAAEGLLVQVDVAPELDSAGPLEDAGFSAGAATATGVGEPAGAAGERLLQNVNAVVIPRQ